MLEAGVQKIVWAALASLSIMFRFNTGKAWVPGEGGRVRKLADGSILITHPRPIALGASLMNGSPVVGTSDLGGWTSITITQAMVGKKIAVTTWIETKRSSGGKASKEQFNFIEQVRSAGGIAGVASSADVAKRIIFDYIDALNQK